MNPCPTPEELDLYADRAPEIDWRLKQPVWRHLCNVPLTVIPQERRLRVIAEHVAGCPACQAALAESDAPLQALKQDVEQDPGDDFTARILQQAQRPQVAKPLTNTPFDRMGRRLAWGFTGLVALLLLGLWLWPDGVGRDRVLLARPETVLAGAPCIFPVQVTDARGRPIRNSRVTVWHEGIPPWSGRTDAEGFAQARLVLPASSETTSYALAVDVRTRSGRHMLETFVTAKPAGALHLTTDKPLYQPGQTVRLRLLLLNRLDTTPIAGREVEVTIRDPRSNLLFKKTMTSSEYGIVHLDFPLDSEAATGAYTVEARAGDEQASRTISVARYTLPKFKAAIAAEKTWFLPGETIDGAVQADYTFGKPCAGAVVKVEATDESTLGAEESFAATSGTADEKGHFDFHLALPQKLFGSPKHGGSALVTVKATVTDAGGSLREISRDYPVSPQAILLSVLPESGMPVKGVVNEFYVVASYPDGSPAEAEVAITDPVQATINTDAQGVAVFTATPATGVVTVMLSARDAAGRSGKLIHALSPPPAQIRPEIYEPPTVLLRTDKAVYRAGEVAQVTVLAPGQSGAAFLEVTRDKQPVQTQAVALEKGRAQVELPLAQDTAGLLTVQAYLPGAKAPQEEWTTTSTLVAAGSRAIYVQPAAQLQIAIDNLQESRPGEAQQAVLRVTDPEGNGVPAAVGLAGVDEAVFALEDQYPGLARLFAELQREVDDPAIEVHDSGLPGYFRLDDGPPTEARAARVALAAYAARPLLQVDQYGEWDTVSRQEEVHAGRANAAVLLALGFLWLLTFTYIVTSLIRRFSDLKWHTWWHITGWSICLGFVGLMMLLLANKGENSNLLFGVTLLTMLFAYIYRRIGRADVILITMMVILPVSIAFIFPIFARAHEYARQTQTMNNQRMLDLAVPMKARVMDKDMAIVHGTINTFQWSDQLEGAEKLHGFEDERSTPTPAAVARVREYFPETLAWMPEIITDKDGEAEVTLPAADSITTWRLSLLANAKDGRLGSADIPYKVFQDFFVDMDMPSRLTVGDTFSLPVAVYNYAKEAQTITLTLDARQGLRLDGEDVQTVSLAPGAVGKANFTLRADEAGRAQLTVKAVSPGLTDSVRRHLDVVPQGVREETADNAVLREQATLHVSVPADIDLKHTDLNLRFYPGPVSQTLAGLESMLQEPYGCFEQTTSTTYPNLMILRYLRESGAKNPEIIARAQTYVQLGYQRLLTFEVGNGGFSLFGDAPADFAITSLGLMEFQDMAQVQAVDDKLLERMTTWLVHHWKDAGPTERTYAILPLARAGQQDLVSKWIAQRSGVQDLSTYELALLANAAAELKHPRASELANMLAERSTQAEKAVCWPNTGERNSDYAHWMAWDDCETTGLAVQALAKDSGRPDLVRKGVDYLAAHRDPGGGWGATQATVQALRALLAVNTTAQKGTVAVTVNGKAIDAVELEGDSAVVSVPLTAHLRAGRNTVTLRAKPGVSPACQLAAGYYTLRPAQARGNAVSVSYDKSQLNSGDIATATVRVRVPKPVEMAMVDLAVPPGFLPLAEDLEAMKAAGKIERYETTGPQLILYLKTLNGPATFRYRLRALFPITATVGRSAVYPYYQPEERYLSGTGRIQVN